MLYRIETVYEDRADLGDKEGERHSFGFELEEPIDRDYPAIIVIKTEKVQYHKNRVALNENFIGYLIA